VIRALQATRVRDPPGGVPVRPSSSNGEEDRFFGAFAKARAPARAVCGTGDTAVQLLPLHTIKGPILRVRLVIILVIGDHVYGAILRTSVSIGRSFRSH
jgi:hypothetical protein